MKKYRILWNWHKDETIVDQFSLLEETRTLAEAVMAMQANIDIQEDAGDRPLKYRIELVIHGAAGIVMEIDAADLTREERLQFCDPETRAAGKKIFGERLKKSAS